MTYERFGDRQAPSVLLVMGVGAQMLGWPEGFCARLAARGLQVIRFDNRDAGLSSHFPGAPASSTALSQQQSPADRRAPGQPRHPRRLRLGA
jgi:alpha-beta hydrolase superfamily lysophospholipase